MTNNPGSVRGPSPTPPRTLLVLGGGGLKGLAHIGAWQALEERGIRPDAIVGTSVGALFGALIASGVPTAELVDRARRLEHDDIVQVNRRAAWIRGVRQPAVFHGDRYLEYIREILPVERFDELDIPLRMNAVSLVTGMEVWFGAGARTDIPLAEAIYASGALPLYFPPLPADGEHLADGALRNTLAVGEALRWGADRVLAVDVSADLQVCAPDEWLDYGLVGVYQRVLDITSDREKDDDDPWAEHPVTRVRPEIGHLGTFEFGHAEYAIERGYLATRDALRALADGEAEDGRGRFERLLDRASRAVPRFVGALLGGSRDDG